MQLDASTRDVKQQRLVVSWPVLWNFSDECASGRILDINNEGLFLAPELGNFLNFLHTPGKRLWFHCYEITREFQVGGVIRWRGWSKQHECFGFGIELDRMDMNLPQILRQLRADQQTFVDILQYENDLIPKYQFLRKTVLIQKIFDVYHAN